MADAVPLRHDPTGEAYRAEVYQLCWLARIPDMAEVYIRRHTAIEDVLADCVVAVFGKRLPQDAARHFAALRGPAGTARRPVPIHPEPHGVRRRAIANPSPDRIGPA